MEWLYKAKRFFRIYEIPKDQKVTFASIYIEGKALPWFQLMEKTNQVPTWLALSTVAQIQFGPSHFDNPHADLYKLTQTSSITEYYDMFTDLANRSCGMDDTQLLDCFIGGLRPDLKKEVMSRYPHSLMQVVSLAKLFEEKFLPPLNPYYRPRPLYNQPKPLSQIPPKSIPLPTPLNNNQPNNTPLLPTPPKPTTLKKLTPVDIQFRHDKGLCFTCDERYTLNHRFTNKHYFLIQTAEEIEPDDFENIPPNDEQSPSETQEHHLSYNALKGITGRGTIRFKGLINGHEVQILVDGGSSDNFIQPRIATFLQLPIHSTPNFRVVVGNGDLLTCEGQVR